MEHDKKEPTSTPHPDCCHSHKAHAPGETEKHEGKTEFATQQQAQIIVVLLLLATGLLAGQYLPGKDLPKESLSASGAPVAPKEAARTAAIDATVFPVKGIPTEATWGDVFPVLVERGVIDYDKFTGIFAKGNTPLTAEELAILTKDMKNAPIVFTSENARFTVNALWALGLAQESDVLLKGPMQTNGTTPPDRFASTGGWTLGRAGAMEYYAKWNLLGLTSEDQQRVTRIAEGIYRPCCGNSTAFPDCNHGMAMLGLIELMVSQGASDEEIYRAALAANTYWFPQNVAELATYFAEIEGVAWESVDPVRAVGKDFASGAGARQVTQALQEKGLLPKAPTGGGSCGA